MTAQPDTPAPDTGSYEVIHLGGQAAVVVPVADFLRLRALEQAATAEDLEDAEDTAAVLEWKTRDAAVADFREGKIRSFRTYFDDLSLIEQIAGA
jgi:ketosteroid isomerase-like protein